MAADKTILIVDDEPNIRGFLRLVLEDEGYTVETATDGCEALTKPRTRLPDVILLDLIMPVLDGIGFMRACRQNPAWGRVPVLVMSAGDALARDETLDPHDVLLKPFDLDVLLRRLGALLT